MMTMFRNPLHIVLAILILLLVGGGLLFMSLLKSPGSPKSAAGDLIRPPVASTLPISATRTAAAVPEAGVTDLWFGSSTAEVRMFLYSDLECPFCRQLDGYLPDLQQEFGNTFAFTFRHFPLSNHPQADMEAEVVLCLQRQNTEMAKGLIQETFVQTKSSGTSFTDEQYRALALAQGADAEKLASCMENAELRSVVAGSVDEARALGVRYTPTVYLRSKDTTVIIEGAQPKDHYRQAISYLLGVVE